MDEPVKVIIAGGGTGGHLFPGIAIAEEISRRNQANEILFVGTERGLEKRILPGMGYRLQTIDVAGIRGMGVMKTMGNIMKIPMSMYQSKSIIGPFNPHVVVGVGGYASGPAAMTAHYMGIATVIAEQNAVPGMTNRILGRFVDRIYVTFPETARWFNTNKVLVTGNPVRKSFVERKSERQAASSEHITVLIFGGSQGAHAINEAVVAAMPLLKKIQGPLRIIHQTGAGDAETVAAAYRAHEIDARVSPFITDMATAYDEADLLVCRAGATTVAEVMVSGKPAIFIPFAHAVGDHQRLNAQVLVDAGAARLILEKDLTGEALADMVQRLLKDREALAAMGERARASGTADAAARIVDDCWHIIGRSKR
jgi:UDP-N-acetylglucosamine--N-acetylmuramyl-(pentapeptide) pyrophosphoryl-undecaprenol N-acetylglucosamine transferase